MQKIYDLSDPHLMQKIYDSEKWGLLMFTKI